MIPAHNTDGFLPVGVHGATWAEFQARFSGTARRRVLLAMVQRPLGHFALAGAQFAMVGGSFVTTKAQPGDVDIVIEMAHLDLTLVHPALLDLSPMGRVAQKAVFGAEFFPDVLSEGATGRPMAEFFQFTRDGVPVGIVRLDLSTV